MNFAIVDWECTSLKSDQGFLLCGGFKPLGKPGYVIGLHNTGFKKDPLVLDAKLALALRDEVEKYDGIITWNGIMFDIPFLNDRLMLSGQDPVEKRFHIDIMYQARQGKSRLTSSRLDWVSKQLDPDGEKDRKTSLEMTLWKRAQAEALAQFGNGRKNYQYIVDHCKADLNVTEQVYERLKNRVQTISKR